MKKKDLLLLLFFFLCMMFLFSCKKKANRQEDKAYTYKRSKENIELNIWSYYSALQQEVFLKTVDEFNLTRGKDLNITVHVMSPGSMNDLEANLFALTDKNFAQGTYPDMAFMYRDTGKVLDQKGYLVDLSNYLTKEEMDDFVPGFLEEGRLGNQREGIKILPVAKSTEVFYLNATAWKSFSDATGATLSDLDSREGLIEVAKKYYEYTDALTPEEGDGKAFFGQEDFATYFLVGAKQMGVDLVSVDPEKSSILFRKMSYTSYGIIFMCLTLRDTLAVPGDTVPMIYEREKLFPMSVLQLPIVIFPRQSFYPIRNIFPSSLLSFPHRTLLRGRRLQFSREPALAC